MTSLALLSEAILSGQVPDHEVPALCKEHAGLEAELEYRSRAARARIGETRRVQPPTGARRVDSFNLVCNATFGHCLVVEEVGCSLKTGGFLSEFFSSFHWSSVLPLKHGADG